MVDVEGGSELVVTVDGGAVVGVEVVVVVGGGPVVEDVGGRVVATGPALWAVAASEPASLLHAAISSTPATAMESLREFMTAT